MRPGEIICGDGPAPSVAPRRVATVTVHNAGRLPAFVSSHFPLERASSVLHFDREAVRGARLDLPAGASLRLAPGQDTEVTVRWD